MSSVDAACASDQPAASRAVNGLSNSIQVIQVLSSCRLA
jgi:hypothetical protein